MRVFNAYGALLCNYRKKSYYYYYMLILLERFSTMKFLVFFRKLAATFEIMDIAPKSGRVTSDPFEPLPQPRKSRSVVSVERQPEAERSPELRVSNWL